MSQNNCTTFRKLSNSSKAYYAQAFNPGLNYFNPAHKKAAAPVREGRRAVQGGTGLGPCINLFGL